MLTNEQLNEARTRGTAWGIQEAELMIEAVENGRWSAPLAWAMGTYAGALPHDDVPSDDRSEEQGAERDQYEQALDRAARAAYIVKIEKWERDAEIAALVTGGGGLVLLFDNGGGATLMTGDYCHHYTDAAALAADVRAWMANPDVDFDDNQPDYRRLAHSEDFVVGADDLRRASTGYCEDLAEVGAMARAFAGAWLAQEVA